MVYFDDIIVFSEDMDKNKKHLEKVFKALR